jgi:hypothetical protein
MYTQWCVGQFKSLWSISIFVDVSVDTERVVLDAMQICTVCYGGLRLREGGDICRRYLDLLYRVQGWALRETAAETDCRNVTRTFKQLACSCARNETYAAVTSWVSHDLKMCEEHFWTASVV